MIKLSISVTLLLALFFLSCKKEAGPGGKTRIKGKVIYKKYDTYYTQVISQYNPQGENVYITYGNETTVGDNVKTSYDGSYEFTFMRKGKYKIWAISKDSSLKLVDLSATKAIIKEIEITQRKGDFTVEDITIIDN